MSTTTFLCGLAQPGGGTDDDSNKRVLYPVCHDAQTKVEAGQRAAGRYDRDAVLAVMRRLERERRLV